MNKPDKNILSIEEVLNNFFSTEDGEQQSTTGIDNVEQTTSTTDEGENKTEIDVEIPAIIKAEFEVEVKDEQQTTNVGTEDGQQSTTSTDNVEQTTTTSTTTDEGENKSEVNTEIPLLIKAEIEVETAELSEDENEIIDSPIEEEEGADLTTITEESIRLHGQINKMQLALQTAEEFIFPKYSTEDVSATLKKFWEWIKTIVQKIRTFIITIIKRIQIWLAGDMKDIVKWATENESKITEGLKEFGEVTFLKINILSKNITTADAIIKAVNEPINKLKLDLVNSLKNRKFDETLYDTCIDYLKNNTVEKFDGDTFNGEISASAFNEVIKIVETLKNAKDIRELAGFYNQNVKYASLVLSIFNSLSTDSLPEEDVANLKKLAIAVQRLINFESAINYRLTSNIIKQIHAARAFAVKLVKSMDDKTKKEVEEGLKVKQ